MFSTEQKTKLSAPLSREHVKTRQQGGRSVSYIEGWRAIDVANSIFGFDGWVRETMETRCVAENPRKLSSGGDGHGVTYVVRVRIMVPSDTQPIIREGWGAGHGIDRDLGQAHESAVKEAETDAMKRALMTFGNPFGLALYDKEQTNVASATPTKTLTKAQAGDLYKALETELRGCVGADAINKWAASTATKNRVAQLPLDWADSLRTERADMLTAASTQ